MLDALTQLSSLELDRAHYRPKDFNKKIKKNYSISAYTTF